MDLLINFGGDGRAVRSLDFCSKGSEPPSDLPQSVRRELVSSLFFKAKWAKGITRYGHIERKDQDRTARLVYLVSELFVLST